ncbi:MAG: hypothetical protein J6Z18_00540 [Prevotella sp.]|nr:hypothetical protein [Prevotella sp.]
MRVLHYIPQKEMSAGFLADYLSLLNTALSKTAEVDVVYSLAQFKKKIREQRPDIVHIHACWNITGYRVQQLAVKEHLPHLLSLHGKMQPWHLKDHFYLQKIPLLVLGQHRAIAKADAIQVDGAMEMKRMTAIHWNERLGQIDNALITKTITQEEMAERMTALYQKVIDSNAFFLMTDEEKRAEQYLLQVGLSAAAAEEIDYPRLSDASWRRICLHAEEEGITDIVEEGSRQLQQPPLVDTKTIERFNPTLPKNKEMLETGQIRIKNPLTKASFETIRKDEEPTEAELSVCQAIMNLSQELKQKTLSKRHLIDLYKVLRYTDYDEDKITRMLKHLKLFHFTESLLQILHDSLALQEGFMPFDPRNNKRTKKIIQSLHNLNIQ